MFARTRGTVAGFDLRFRKPAVAKPIGARRAFLLPASGHRYRTGFQQLDVVSVD
jgi:hypothetical protein